MSQVKYFEYFVQFYMLQRSGNEHDGYTRFFNPVKKNSIGVQSGDLGDQSTFLL
jgi:hypothetical protein